MLVPNTIQKQQLEKIKGFTSDGDVFNQRQYTTNVAMMIVLHFGIDVAFVVSVSFINIKNSVSLNDSLFFYLMIPVGIKTLLFIA